MIPLKWKIFKVINYFFLFATVGILGFSIYNISLHVADYETSDVILYSTILLGLLIIAANSTINIYMVDRCYPDNYVKTLRKASNTFLVLTIIIIVLILAIFVFVLSDEFRPIDDNIDHDNTGIWVLAIFFILISIGVYVCWMQIVLGNTIRDNFIKSLENFLKN